MSSITNRNMSGKALGLVLSVAMSMALLSTLLLASDVGRVQAQATNDCTNGVAVPDPDDNPGLVSDCEALLAAQSTLEGSKSLNWSGPQPIGSWEGINLGGSPSRVVALRLWSYDLSGEIPSELGNLSNLTQLNLSGNQLSGEIPSELGSLSGLNFLGLSGNQLTGTIPSELGNLSSLHYLHLAHNDLSGVIPSELGNLSNLRALYLEYNELDGTIPTELGDVTNLIRLQLNNNDLSGTIPSELLALPNLQIMSLWGNSLSGEVSSHASERTALSSLYSSAGGADWQISENWGSSEPLFTWYGVGIDGNGHVTALHLAHNDLSGEIPSELGSLSSLIELYLDNNQLTGEIPAELGNLHSLNLLVLGSNELSGEIPSELGNLSSLTWLLLDDNQLSGEIPSELGDLSSLDLLILGINELSGEIPPELGNLSNLTWLLLGSNELSGEIPSELGNLSNLTWLELSSNELSGEIPPELGNLSNMTWLELDGNELSGTIPSELGNLSSSLLLLLLSGNQLSGCVPSELRDVQDNDFDDLNLPFCDETATPSPTHEPTPEAPADECVGTVSGNGAIIGTWSDDCASEGRSGSYASYYTFTLTESAEVTITAESSVDTYLFLREGTGRDGAELCNNDDYGSDVSDDRCQSIDSTLDSEYDSGLVASLGAGAYTIEVTTYTEGETGTFTLTVGGLPADVAPTPTPTPTPTPEPTITITFGDLNWSSVMLQNRIAQYIAEKGYGYSTSVEFGTTLPLFQALRAGNIDVLMEVWLPIQQGHLEEALAEGSVSSPGRSLGTDWQSAFVIPKYLQEQYPDLDSVEDLKEEQYRTLFATDETDGKARLVSCVVGWQCEEVNAKQVEGYGLSDHVHIVNPASAEALDADLTEAYENEEPWLGYQWGTNDPALLLDLVRLEEPPYSDECWATTMACAYEESTILIAVNARLSESADDFVEVLTEWDFNVDGNYKPVVRWQSDNPEANLEDAALWWLRGNVDVWSEWVTADAGTAIQSALDSGEIPDGWPQGPNITPDPTPTPEPPADECVEIASADGAISGSWSSDCASEGRIGSYASYYTFTLAESAEVTITAESSVDTYLFLRDGTGRDGAELCSNDDYGSDVNGDLCQSISSTLASEYDSGLVASLGAGAYTIEVTTYTAGETGEFTLTITGLATSTGPEPPPEPPVTDCTDYSESPDLAEKVASDELPSVCDRLPAEPLTIQTLDDTGEYGGMLRRFYLGPSDSCNFFRVSRASLVRFSQDGFSLIPSVARDWEVSDDGREWTFHLREGMKWSDGDDFTADDFVWQYENVILNEDLTPSVPPFLRIGNEVGSIEKVDDTTVKFVFPQPNFLFAEIAAQADEACYSTSRNVPWAPSHYMQQFHIDHNPDVEQEAQDAGFDGWVEYYNNRMQYRLNPDKPTIAPWMFTNPLGDAVVVSERNPYFWAVDPAGNQLPYLDGIRTTLVENTEAGTQSAIRGEIDLQGRHIRLDQYTTLKRGESEGDYTVMTWPAFGGSDVAFFFNMSLPGSTGDAIRTKEFRQALSLAINRESIKEVMFLGFGELRQNVPPPGHPHYPGDDIAKLRTEYDVEEANRLLDSVFPDKDDEGFRLSNGERIVIRVTVTDAFGPWPDTAQAVGRAWEAVGVKTDVDQTNRNEHFDRWWTNEWAVIVWNEDSTASTFSSIVKRAPDGFNYHAPGCGAWLDDPDGENAFPCLQESLDLLDMHRRGPGLPEAERNALGKEIYKTIVENQYSIGTVGLSPMVQGVVVKKNTLHNVPDSTANDLLFRTPNSAFPEQWYYASSEPPSDSCVETVSEDGSISGSWSSDCDSEGRSGSYASYYTFTLAESAEVTITAESSVDTYLFLRQGSGRDGAELCDNDDHGSDVSGDLCQGIESTLESEYDSGLVASLGAGAYTIEVTTYDEGETGAFTLTIGGLPVVVLGPSTDRAALVALYNATNGANWTRKANWLSDEPLSEWQGVTTDDDGRVIQIELWENNMVGSIPSDLGNLSSLERLSLDKNELSGEIPAELGSLSKLTEFYLQENKLSGAIPSGLGRLSSLTVLRLGGNQLSGQIPEELGNLANLERMFLEDNNLSGEIPADLGRLSRLDILRLDRNQISGEIPSELSGLSNLTQMNLHGNQLSDEIPSELGNLSSVEVLSLSYNQLTGDIPSELGSLANLRELYLNSNDLSGEIPAELGNLSNLTELYLWGNELSGGIPSELGGLINLQRLNLGENELTGEIPIELGNLVNLQRLNLGDNELSGGIPSELGNLANLERMYLHDNRLSGEIPSELGSLAILERLYLADNQLSGEIPSELGSLANLQILNLTRNQLSGEVPAELGGLVNLDELALGGNRLRGAVPAELANLSNLTELYLWGNDLSGGIPSVLGSLVNLQRLELGENELTGEIPTELGNLVNLQRLNLGDNDLSGGIPSELGNLANLERMYLHDNQLNGEIPSELGSLAILERLYLAENQLSGDLPSELGSLAVLQILNLTRNQLSGEVPPELGSLANLDELALGGNRLRGAIPAELGNLSNLTELYLWGNELSGGIPSELGDLVSLQRLELGENELRGGIPSELGNLVNLQRLNLGENELRGGIPSELGNLANLELMYLHDNQLSGEIPDELGSLANLQILNLTRNQLSGEIPAELGNLSNLTELYMWSNQLSGGIPPELGQLTSLAGLSLARNQLSGGIPSELGGLVDLEFLHLFRNQLSGDIPSELLTIPDLKFMALYGNQFSGGVPEHADERTILTTIYNSTGGTGWTESENWGSAEPVVNWIRVVIDTGGRVTGLWLAENQLSGKIPSELGDLTNLIALDLRTNELSGEIPSELSNLENLEQLFLAGNQLSGCIPVGLQDVPRNDLYDLGLEFCSGGN